ncbi:ribosome-binding ATPase YchF [Candidatus Levyibacteriota bacterium]|nr:ribosome-binding ATPase YchF [Candidatus Levybacteria bacterium]
MNLSVGIVGLPNIGKSTLFNALLKKQQALVANYPFATIEPNVGVVPVPDNRLDKIAEITKNEEKIPQLPPIRCATVEFLDIAGLVKGASNGAGLGNKFLSHIREVDIICHVVRAFSDENVMREGSISPKDDYQAIEMELMLADLASVQVQMSKMKRFQLQSEKDSIEKLFKALSDGIPARSVSLTDEEQAFSKQLFLLSAKREILVLNVSEEDYTEDKIPELIIKYSQILDVSKNIITVVCAKVESELSELDIHEQVEYLLGIGISQSGLERVIKKAYEALGLISFLTAGEKEVRAWTIPIGIKAVDAAGVIHTDFIKKFIKAEIVSFSDFIVNNGWKGSREVGKARFEGKDYIFKDGDVVEFRIGS